MASDRKRWKIDKRYPVERIIKQEWNNIRVHSILSVVWCVDYYEKNRL